MPTKPCGRAACSNTITAPPWRLSKRRFCSNRCSTRHRIETGSMTPHAFLTHENRARGGVKGGKAAGERRHREALTRAVVACEAMLTADLLAGLTARQAAAFRVLLGRAYLQGELRGEKKTDTNRRYWQRVAEGKRPRAAA